MNKSRGIYNATDQNDDTVDEDWGRVSEGDEHALTVKVLELGVQLVIGCQPLIGSLCQGDAHQKNSEQKPLDPDPLPSGQN